MILEATSTESKPGSKAICPACGNEPVEFNLREVCDVCGKLLSEGFQPLDAIRSSYKMQRRDLDFQTSDDNGASLFDEHPPLISSVAWACTVYSMVPYLGVLFVPFALVFGGFDYVKSGRGPESGSGTTTLVPLVWSMILLAVQLLLWSLLYLIPEIGI